MLSRGTEKYEVVYHGTISRATAELGSKFPIWRRFAKFKHFFEHCVVQRNVSKKKRPRAGDLDTDGRMILILFSWNRF